MTRLQSNTSRLREDAWTRVTEELRRHLLDGAFAETVAELSEWFWDGCLDEACDDVGAALLSDTLAHANFEALALLHAAGRGGRSAASVLLSSGRLDDEQAELLCAAMGTRPRLFRVGRERGHRRRRLHDLQDGRCHGVLPESWPVPLSAGDLMVGRLVGDGNLARWVGPVYPFPVGTPAEVLLDLRQGLAELEQAGPTERAGATERFLVDLHHQWFFHVFTPRQRLLQQDQVPALFSLLPGKLRPSG